MNKMKWMGVIVGFSLLLGACNGEEKANSEEDKSVEQEVKVDQAAVDKSDVTKNDEDLKAKFEQEEGISQVSIIVTEDSGRMALLDFEVEADMTEADAKKVTEQFAKQLKEKYSEYEIDAQAHKSGETIAHVNL